MINAIKMEFLKLRKFKSTWIILLVIIGVTFISAFSTKAMINQYKHDANAYQQYQDAMDKTGDVSLGFSSGATGDMGKYIKGDKIDMPYLLTGSFSGNLLITLIAIYLLIFFNSEQKNGFIKNIAGYFSNRSYLIASKAVIS